MTEELVQTTETINLEDDGDVVNPWEVTSQKDGGIDYDKLIRKIKK